MSAPLPPGQKRYYYCNDSATVMGPVPADDLLALAKGGGIKPQAVICEEGKDEWIAFDTMPDTIFSPAAKEKLVQERGKALMEDYKKNKVPMLVFVGIIIIIVFAYCMHQSPS